MKKIVLLFLFFSSVALSQTRGISYQALIIDPVTQELPGFNNSNAPLANKDICLKFSFIDELNTLEYEEIFSVRTDNYGMVNLIIGTEVRTGGYAASFEGIQWSLLPKNLKIDLSTDGCTTFTEISNSPFTAVPFALFAVNTVDNPLILDNQRDIALLRNLIIATQIGAGLDADGGYTPEATTFFINNVTSLKEADIVLDNQVNTNENNINTNTGSITTNTSNITTNTININNNTTDIATKVNITDIVDDLITGGTNVPLSAEQGKVLKGLIDSSVNIIVEDVLTSSSTMNALSANQGKVLKAYVDANSTNANLTGMVTSLGNTTTVVTNANLTGDVTSVGNTTTIGTDKVVSSMILDGTIVVGDLADDAVETAKIKDANVTDAKIATVSASKLRGTVGIPNGGTSHTSYTQGDILYATSATTLAKLPKGTAGQVLAMNTGATAPEWLDSSGGSNTPYVLNTVNAELGGYVIEVNSDGTHGLVVAMQDQGVSSWYNADNLLSNPSSHDTNGAKFKDWRLPSKRELNLIYSVYLWGNGASLNDHSYWISTTYNEDWGMTQNFADGNLGYTDRGHSNYVRAVRAF